MISIGRQGSFADVLVDAKELVSRRMDVRWINRGGGCFVHTPGQVAIYPLLPLDRLKLGVIEFRRRLEQTLVRSAADLEVLATVGVSAPGAVCRCGQFAFIGAGIRSWISHHGMLINIAASQADLDLVQWTKPAVRVTTLSAQRLRTISMSAARECLMRRLAESFGYVDYQVHTGHPGLHRTTRKVYVFT
ncbi:MAG: hypothetical protein NTW75_06125 [Planctomycetales bacterium]|nr:hypothetical protein [Planctomycetales bacterium]